MAVVNVFVAARGNLFMREIAAWIAEAAVETGREARLIDDRLPAADGSINLVVAPHEFFEMFDAPRSALHRAASSSVCVNTEQPGTSWFGLALRWCRDGRIALDISDQGVDALRGAGIDAQRLRLGGVASMHAVQTPDRPIDVLFLGGLDDRRGAALADLAPHLWYRHADIRLTGIDRPIDASTAQAVFGADKHRLLASAKLLLNIHRHREGALPAYFEWARAVEAMANGCVIVTEPSEGCAPLVAGTHYVEATLDAMPASIDELLGDEARRAEIGGAAGELILGELAMTKSLEPLLGTIEAALHPPERSRKSSRHLLRWRPAQRSTRRSRFGPFRPFLPVLASAKRIAMAENAALSRLDAARCELEHGTRQHILRTETPAYSAAMPEVSVVVSLYNYAGLVGQTLDSIVASAGIEFEVIVVDDHSTDDSRSVARQFLDDHPTVPMLLLAKEANEGLSAARNTGFDQARADLVMVMDADNEIYPSCLRKLADALANDAGADAAYSILEDFGDQRNVRSALAWDVDRLCRANYIDAQAMIRKASWQRLGGYRPDDEHIVGWEDWDFWLRLAAQRGRALLVTEILGRYRVQRGSMVSLSNLATDDAIAAMRRRHPSLPWPGADLPGLLDRILPAEDHYAAVAGDDDPDLMTS